MDVRLPIEALGFAIVVTLAACGGGGSGASNDDAVERTEPAAGSAVDGSVAYLRRCGGCHGVVGSDQARRSLSGIDQLTREDIDIKIRNGGPQMPGFDTSLTSSEISAIIDHIIDNR